MAGIDVDDLADEVMKGLQEYSTLATDTMKITISSFYRYFRCFYFTIHIYAVWTNGNEVCK